MELSIVIVSWNVKELLGGCLRSIIETVHNIEYEIVVVDNNSSDGSVDFIKTNFPQVVLIENFDNRGFASANNQGFKAANGEYIFILNPDTVVKSDAISILLKQIKTLSKAGIVGPKLILGDGKTQFACARKLPTLLNVSLLQGFSIGNIPVFGKYFKKRMAFPYNYNKLEQVEAISGASMLMKKDLLFQVGLFDEDFLHGGEDIFLCNKITEFGKKIYYIPECEIIHFHGQSAKQDKARVFFNNIKSDRTYFNKTNGYTAGKIYHYMVLFILMPRMFMSSNIKYFLKLIDKNEYRNRMNILQKIINWGITN